MIGGVAARPRLRRHTIWLCSARLSATGHSHRDTAISAASRATATGYGHRNGYQNQNSSHRYRPAARQPLQRDRPTACTCAARNGEGNAQYRPRTAKQPSATTMATTIRLQPGEHARHRHTNVSGSGMAERVWVRATDGYELWSGIRHRTADWRSQLPRNVDIAVGQRRVRGTRPPTAATGRTEAGPAISWAGRQTRLAREGNLSAAIAFASASPSAILMD